MQKNNNNENNELKNSEDIFCGYASIFNTVDNQQDIVSPNSINIDDVKNAPLLWQHDVKKPIGKIIDAYIDDIGLFIYCKIIKDMFYGKEAYFAIKNNVIGGLSIGYTINNCEYRNDIEDSGKIRILKDIKIVEISVVSLPANELTLLSVCKDVIG